MRTKLRNLAQQASAGVGVPTPSTMLAVASPDHQAAETIVSGAVINDHAPVYVVMMTGGPFTAQEAPPGVPLPQGDVMTLTVDATTFRVTDVGISNNKPDLTKIGPVVVDLSIP